MTYNTLELSELLAEKGYIRGPFGSSLLRREMLDSGEFAVYEQSNAIKNSREFRFFIDRNKFDELKRFAVKENDLIISCSGTVGRISKIERNSYPGIISQALLILRSNEEIILPDFLKYFLQTKQGQYELLNASHGSVQLNIAPRKVVEKIPIPCPDIKTQDAICKILLAIDKKIELNQEMNETLEQIAKTLFKSWFIDFDPVRAKVEGKPTGLSKEISDLFPDSFIDSELGEIPKDWELSNLSSNLEFVLGGDWGKETLKDEYNQQVRCIRGADIPNIQNFISSYPPKRFIKESSLEKRKLKKGDLVLEISGGSPTQSTGRIIYITEDFLSTQDSPVVYSNFCRILRTDAKLSKYIYYYFRCLYDSDQLFQYETGTTGIKNFGYKYFSEEVYFPLPNESVLIAFSEIIESFLNKKGTIQKEIITLTKLKDTLLPKLISGEIKISEAENLIEEESI